MVLLQRAMPMIRQRNGYGSVVLLLGRLLNPIYKPIYRLRIHWNLWDMFGRCSSLHFARESLEAGTSIQSSMLTSVTVGE